MSMPPLTCYNKHSFPQKKTSFEVQPKNRLLNFPAHFPLKYGYVVIKNLFHHEVKVTAAKLASKSENVVFSNKNNSSF